MPENEKKDNDIGAETREDEKACEQENTADTEPAKDEKKKSFIGKKKEAAHESKTAEENEALKNENAELKDKYLRLMAEFDNYKKRTAKENETRYLDSRADTIKKFLPVIDSFERALAQEETEGLKLIYEKFLAILADSNVEVIAETGVPFNPNVHNAVMHVDDESFGENTVCEVFEKGYRMGDRILRYAMVKVAN